MVPAEIRPFRRSDREQLTSLVNAHVAAVVPGMSVSVSTMLSHLEREPDEPVTGPWVSERLSLVAVQQARIAAAAHLLRYAADDRVSPSYRGAGCISWLLFWPEAPGANPYWSDAAPAASELMTACVRQLDDWGASSQHAGGGLPAPGVYGVPEQWPHVRALYQRAGFSHTGHTEAVYLARAEDLPHPAAPPVAGLDIRRSVGINGTRLSAVLGGEVTGYIELEILAGSERLPRQGGWADIGNLHVAGPYRRRGIGTWLLGQAASWLRLAQAGRLLDYAWVDGPDGTARSYDGYRAFLAASGFTELTRTSRGWTRATP